MKKLVPIELLNNIVNALVVTTGLSYVQVQKFIEEINKCEVYKEEKEEKPNGK